MWCGPRLSHRRVLWFWLSWAKEKGVWVLKIISQRKQVMVVFWTTVHPRVCFTADPRSVPRWQLRKECFVPRNWRSAVSGIRCGTSGTCYMLYRLRVRRLVTLRIRKIYPRDRENPRSWYEIECGYSLLFWERVERAPMIDKMTGDEFRRVDVATHRAIYICLRPVIDGVISAGKWGKRTS